METLQVYHGDCLEVMKDIEDGSVDMICADPPYGTTACAWDSIIPLEPMWEQLKRIIKKNGAIVLTASQPFTTTLISSNMGMFKYCWVWEKNKPTGGLNAKYMPMKKHEDIIVFYCKTPTFNGQKIKRTTVEFKAMYRKNDTVMGVQDGPYGCLDRDKKRIRPSYEQQQYKNPETILLFKKDDKRDGKSHPTQKPVALMEYLIKTYTNKGEMVLDFCMGSGTTGVACKNLNRNFIGIEKDLKYFEIAKNRIENPEYKPPSKKEKQKGENKGLFPDDEIANLLTIKSH